MNGVSVCTASTLAREMSYLTELSALSVCSPLETSWTWFPWLRALWSWTLSVCSVTRRQHTLRDWGQRKRWGRGDMIYIRAEEGSYSRNITCLSDLKVVFPWTSGVKWDWWFFISSLSSQPITIASLPFWNPLLISIIPVLLVNQLGLKIPCRNHNYHCPISPFITHPILSHLP